MISNSQKHRVVRKENLTGSLLKRKKKKRKTLRKRNRLYCGFERGNSPIGTTKVRSEKTRKGTKEEEEKTPQVLVIQFFPRGGEAEIRGHGNRKRKKRTKREVW